MLSTAKTALKQAWVRTSHLKAEHQRLQLPEPGPELWSQSVNTQDQLCIGNLSATELVAEFGSPLHVLDERRLATDIQNFQQAWNHQRPGTIVGCSYKTNPLPHALKLSHQQGCWAEVISHFELWLALQLQVPPTQIIFNGPGKTPASLALAVEAGIELINIDNLSEIDQLAALAQQHGRKLKVGIRVVTDVGWSGQFGLRLDNGEAAQALQNIQQHKQWLQACGLHFHLGTGLKNIATYTQAVEQMLQFSQQQAETLGIQWQYLDLGGGFGVPTVRSLDTDDVRLMAERYPVKPLDVNAAPSIDAYAAAICTLVERFYPAKNADSPRLILEPGRAIFSSSQVLLLKVLARKAGERVMVDGGKNITIPLAYEYHHFFAANRVHATQRQLQDIYGPLCHPADIIGQRRLLPELKVGDVLAVMDAGAYFIPNQMNFSNPKPAVVAIANNQAQLVRTAERFEDMIARDHF